MIKYSSYHSYKLLESSFEDYTILLKLLDKHNLIIPAELQIKYDEVIQKLSILENLHSLYSGIPIYTHVLSIGRVITKRPETFLLNGHYIVDENEDNWLVALQQFQITFIKMTREYKPDEKWMEKNDFTFNKSDCNEEIIATGKKAKIMGDEIFKNVRLKNSRSFQDDWETLSKSINEEDQIDFTDEYFGDNPDYGEDYPIIICPECGCKDAVDYGWYWSCGNCGATGD